MSRGLIVVFVLRFIAVYYTEWERKNIAIDNRSRVGCLGTSFSYLALVDRDASCFIFFCFNFIYTGIYLESLGKSVCDCIYSFC